VKGAGVCAAVLLAAHWERTHPRSLNRRPHLIWQQQSYPKSACFVTF